MSTPLEAPRKLPIKKGSSRKATSPFHAPQKLNEVDLLTGSTPIIYITQDIERATGIENLLERYAVVVPWESDLSKALEQKGPPSRKATDGQRTRVFVLERDCPGFGEDDMKGGTYGMMKLKTVQDFIANFASGETPNILVLKNSELIEQECQKNGWKLLAPNASAAKLFEDKITQWHLLHEAVEFPRTIVTDLAHAKERAGAIGFPLVMQFNAGHSGGGTHTINAPEDFAQFAEKFPHREVRLARFIKGNTYTLNAIVSKESEVFTGSISKQLTGLAEATNNPASTVGNDWGAAAQELSEVQGVVIANMAKTIGKKMHENGYAGLFGIDIVVEEGSGPPPLESFRRRQDVGVQAGRASKIYCIEVNTHQPASISFEAKLHQKIGKMPLLFLWIRDMIEDSPHISPEKLPPLFLHGSVRQILYRNKGNEAVSSDSIVVPEGAMASRMKIVKPNEELFRIQKYDINP